MTLFVYQPGSDGSQGWPQPGADPRVNVASPLGANGLVEVAGIRIHDGTFILSSVGGVTDTPEVRQTLTEKSEDHGTFISGSFYGPRFLTVEGLTMTDHLDQLWPAMDLLRKAFSLPGPGAFRDVLFRMPGWVMPRFCQTRASAPLVVEQAVGSAARAPMRRWQATLVAPDPRLYGATEPSEGALIGQPVNVENVGTFPAHLVWEVTGPATNPVLISAGRRIEWDGVVPTGQVLRIDTGQRTALLNGANVYRNLRRFDDLTIPPGTTQYLNGGQGTGSYRIFYRHVWI